MKKIKLFYEQHILPIVYDYSMSLSECVGKLVKVVNGLIEDVQIIDHKTDVAEQNIDVLQERVNTNNTLINNLRSEVEDLEDTVESLPTQDNIDQLNSAITQNSSDIADLETRVTILEGMNVYDRLDQAEQNIIDLQGDVSDIEDDIENLNTDIGIINTSITGIRNDITSINGNIGVILSDISLINDDISDVKFDISDIEGDVARINNDITSINTDITNINSSIGTITGTISGINDDISDINGDISNITSDIISLRSDINNKSTVSYNQIQTSGTKIGEITIDGSTTDIYSPASSTPTIDADDVNFDNDLTPYSNTNVQDVLEELAYFIDFNHNVQLPNVCCSGYITATNKDIYFLIPYHKQCKRRISNAYPLRGNIYVRGVSGYILQNHALNGYSIYASTGTYCRVEQTTSGIFVRLHDDSGFSSTVTTNTPVSVYLDNLLLQRTGT